MTDPASLYAQTVAAFNQHDWRRVSALSARLLPLAPKHAPIHFFAGIAGMEQGQLATALQHLRRATQLDPAQVEFATHFARALSFAQLSREALLAADQALALSPQSAEILDMLGAVYVQGNAHAKAAAAFRQSTLLAPERAAHHFNLATSLIALGDADAAEQELATCLSLDPIFWRAHLTLAHLRQQSPTSHHLPRLQALLAQTRGDAIATACVHLALAKEYEDLADYANAFEHLRLGKAASRERIVYTSGDDEALFAALARAFPQPPLQSTGNPSNEPIFVFGMPRSGTSVVERILSSHPQVTSAGELQHFGRALGRAWGSRSPLWLDPDIAGSAQRIDWQRVGTDYLASTRPATGETARFVDKLPHNFLYAGFIACAFPNAKMICLRRHPMDTCLGNFRQWFGERLPYYNYSFDLLDTGRYYVLFDRLMAHWQQVFPGRILEVQYESLVHSPETVSRQLLEFCGLPWNDACLHFERNPAPMGSASALQVREPLHASAIGRWKRYQTQLADLHQLLTDAGIEISP